MDKSKLNSDQLKIYEYNFKLYTKGVEYINSIFGDKNISHEDTASYVEMFEDSFNAYNCEEEDINRDSFTYSCAYIIFKLEDAYIDLTDEEINAIYTDIFCKATNAKRRDNFYKASNKECVDGLSIYMDKETVIEREYKTMVVIFVFKKY